jgi:hypothetical protein
LATVAIEGLIGQISIGGTLVGFLTGIEFGGDRSQTPWRAMGTYDPTQILKGRRNWDGVVRRAYICGEFVDVFAQNQTEYSCLIYPRGTAGCGTVQGTIAFKSLRVTGMEHESEAAVVKELAFDMYNVTTP